MTELLLTACITLVLTGICSYLTGVFSTLTRSYLQALLTENPSSEKAYRQLLYWKQQADIPRTALSLANLFALSAGSILTGSFAVSAWSAFTVPAAIIGASVVYLVVGQLFPRLLGIRFAKHSVHFTVILLRGIMLFFFPIAKVIERLYDRFTITEDEDEASREEITGIIEEAHEDGAIDAGEFRILTNMLKFSDVRVSDVMTPRTVVFGCHADMTVAEAVDLPELLQFSRIPVHEDESLDSVIGYVLGKEVFKAMISARRDVPLRDLAREVYCIPENARLDRAMEIFLQRREHLFIVVDEYGGVEGLLSMEDVLETMLGVEIMDEDDTTVDLRHLAKQRRDSRVASLQMQFIHTDPADETTGTNDTASTHETLISDAQEQELGTKESTSEHNKGEQNTAEQRNTLEV
jgi:CBS domain containing-hemolysin-like protein